MTGSKIEIRLSTKVEKIGQKTCSIVRVERYFESTRINPSRFFSQSSHIRVDLLSYESKSTDNREQYNWRAEKNLDG